MEMDIPKQYLPLKNSTVLEESLSCFLHHPQIAGVVVALHANDHRWPSLKISTDPRVQNVVGGDTRARSVVNALERVRSLAEKEDFVLVHDAARPCLGYEDLDRLITEGLGGEDGVILASPVHDTVKQVRTSDGAQEVERTLDRSLLWKALTPQMFRVGVLHKALQFCIENDREVTDDASAVEAIGQPVRMIRGRSDNIKVTRPEDIQLAESILLQVSKSSSPDRA